MYHRLILPIAFLSPLHAYASEHRDFSWLVGQFLGIIDLLVVFVFALAFLVFLWGIMQAWIIGGGDHLSVEKGKRIALAGVIGLVIMTAVWAIVALLSSSLFYG